MIHHPIWLWVGFIVFILVLLALDLGVFHKKDEEIGMKQALGLSAVWIAIALAFNLGVYHFMGPKAAAEYFACYILEKSLSVDNLFVFLLIFSYFKVPQKYQHRVLFYGILGALVMRGIFIGAGVALVRKFDWILYVFGLILFVSGLKLFKKKEGDAVTPDEMFINKLARKVFKVTPNFHGDHFFVREGGILHATPLFLTLLVVEVSDVIFAVDSIPAALAITLDPFVIFSSNVFAILGLRALYFALAGLLKLFHHLHYGLAIILVFIGGKMLLHGYVHTPMSVTMAFLVLVLGGSVAASMIWPPAEESKAS